MTNPRVLVFAESFLGEKSTDLDAHIFEEYSRLGKELNLTVIAEKLPANNKIKINLIKVPKISKPMILRTLVRILEYSYATIKNRNKYDVVYTRSLGINFLISSIIAKKFLKKKLVFLISESRITHTSFRGKFFRPFLKNVLLISDSLISSSEYLIQEIDEYLVKVDRTKLVFIHEAVDTTKFKPENKSNIENILLTVARVDPVKGLENLIDSIPFIIKEIPNVKLKIVGSIPNKNYFLKLERHTLELGCNKFIDFVGPVPHNQISNIYLSSKIFVLTSKTEASSISTLEAMSCGIPVVVTKVGGMPSLVKDGINGFLVEPNNPKMIAEKIIELIKNDSLRKKIGTKARETVEKEYSWEKFIDGLINQIMK